MANNVPLSRLENPSQLVLKYKRQLLNSVLLVCPPADNLGAVLQREMASVQVSAFTWDYASYQCHEVSSKACFAKRPPVDWQPAHLIIFMPKTKNMLPLLLAALGEKLRQAEKIWLVGEKREGVESAAKKLGSGADSGGKSEKCSAIGEWRVKKLASARHSQLWEVTPRTPITQTFDHYWQQKSIELPSAEVLELCWLPGVFSMGRLDSGTELLLTNLPELPDLPDLIGHPPKRILDFGCGCGAIGLMLQRRYPSCRVEMVDVNLLALESSQRSAAQNGIKVILYPSVGLQAVPKGLSAIVTNPPFHQGVKQDTGITHQFLQGCADHLLLGGSLMLVANRFLPYADWIEKYVGKARVIAEDTRFKVYHAVKDNRINSKNHFQKNSIGKRKSDS